MDGAGTLSAPHRMDIQEILKYLPHRYPMLLVDKAEILEPAKRIRGIKNVTINEHFFVGHYPGEPIMPGVLILESAAQVGALLFLSQPEFDGMIPLIAGANDVKFRKPVRPGDQLVFDIELDWMRAGMGKCTGIASVDGTTVFSFSLSFKLVPKESTQSR